MPSAARREEVRTAVLAAGSLVMRARPAPRSHRSPRGTTVLAIAAAAAAALLALPDASPPPPPPVTASVHNHGTVHARAGARFARLSAAPDEIIRLEDGTIEIDVAPLHPGDRLVVLVGDAELEVRGTRFEVVAASDRLVAVSVQHGRVDVRPGSGAPASLAAGQSWRPPTPALAPLPPAIEPPPPAPKPRAKPRTVIRTPPPPPAHAPPPEERAYDDAWTAMRGGDFARAAAAFARVFLLAPESALAEDAAFWHAVALARANRRAEAANAFRDFLDRAPRSARAGEANVMLGWISLEADALAEARQRFHAAIDDANPAVRARARDGLEAIARR
jgi:TolA-binding protein